MNDVNLFTLIRHFTQQHLRLHISWEFSNQGWSWICLAQNQWHPLKWQCYLLAEKVFLRCWRGFFTLVVASVRAVERGWLVTGRLPVRSPAPHSRAERFGLKIELRLLWPTLQFNKWFFFNLLSSLSYSLFSKQAINHSWVWTTQHWKLFFPVGQADVLRLIHITSLFNC